MQSKSQVTTDDHLHHQSQTQSHSTAGKRKSFCGQQSVQLEESLPDKRQISTQAISSTAQNEQVGSHSNKNRQQEQQTSGALGSSPLEGARSSFRDKQKETQLVLAEPSSPIGAEFGRPRGSSGPGGSAALADQSISAKLVEQISCSLGEPADSAELLKSDEGQMFAHPVKRTTMHACIANEMASAS